MEYSKHHQLLAVSVVKSVGSVRSLACHCTARPWIASTQICKATLQVGCQLDNPVHSCAAWATQMYSFGAWWQSYCPTWVALVHVLSVTGSYTGCLI